jgi:membrane protein YqaA with SNARE-associated domain
VVAVDLLSFRDWQSLFLEYGVYGLAVNAFIEAIFFPIPPDVLLLALCISNPGSAFLYALVATVFSSAGGIGGYMLGYYGGKPVAERLFGREKVEKVHRLYSSYESLVIFIAGFTPIPYKVFTVTSGVLFASLRKLFLFSMFGRGLRFFIEAGLIHFYGAELKTAFLRNLNVISAVVAVVVVALFLLYRRR